MAKLSKMEISAIANKIAADAREQIIKTNKLFRDVEYPKWFSKFSKTKAYKSLLTYISIQDDVKELLSTGTSGMYVNVLNLDNVLLNLFNKLNREHLTIIVPSIESIERDIIIAQSKNEDIDKLISELTEKYSK